MSSAVHAGEDSRALGAALAAALLVELLVLTAAGWHSHWLAHPQKPADDSAFIEAQIFEIPAQAQLVEARKVPAPAKHEAVLSKVADQGRVAKPEEAKSDEQNQTQGGAPAAPTHGPVAIFSPAPKIPSYLQDKDLKASVVIDFLVNSLGHATVRLVGSSGNEELDALALETAQKWQFRPGEKDHQPVDAKVRLRILFEVQ